MSQNLKLCEPYRFKPGQSGNPTGKGHAELIAVEKFDVPNLLQQTAAGLLYGMQPEDAAETLRDAAKVLKAQTRNFKQRIAELEGKSRVRPRVRTIDLNGADHD